MTQHTLYATHIPVVAGYLCLPGKVKVALATKPSRWHRFWYRALLGWTYEDAA